MAGRLIYDLMYRGVGTVGRRWGRDDLRLLLDITEVTPSTHPRPDTGGEVWLCSARGPRCETGANVGHLAQQSFEVIVIDFSQVTLDVPYPSLTAEFAVPRRPRPSH